MIKQGFDNDKYLAMQSDHIRERISKFGDKLYLEFGGKLYDDYHASRVLPGFEPDSKLRMLMQLADQAEIVIAINAADITKNKVRYDLGITYDLDVLRLIHVFTDRGLYVSSVVITRYVDTPAIQQFKHKLEKLGLKVYRHYEIDGYPSNIPLIVSDEGYGKNDYIETTRPLVVVTAPGPGSGKMATCLSQLYHENKRGVKAGYAKFETFPIWNLPLKHPVNLAYEAATADLNDVNMIDPFHLEAYGKTTVNYNRDVEIYPVLSAIFEGIFGECPYKSPTDMGVNMAGLCIFDDEACREASCQEIIRRYYQALEKVVKDDSCQNEAYIDDYCQWMNRKAYPLTSNTITDSDQLRSQLVQARLNGYAMDDGEIEAGLICVAAPVYDMNRKVVAAVSISGPDYRMREDQEVMIREARQTAHNISRLLGYRL